MKNLLVGLLTFVSLTAFAYDFEGEYKLSESSSPSNCPDGLDVERYDGDYNTSIIVGSSRYQRGVFPITGTYNGCKIKIANSSDMFDYDKNVCESLISTETKLETYTCWSGSFLTGSGRDCNPEKRSLKQKKKSEYYILSYISENTVSYSYYSSVFTSSSQNIKNCFFEKL